MHAFDLGDRDLPRVRGEDDAAAAEWVPVGRLPSMEDVFLDDHLHAIREVLGLPAPPLQRPVWSER